MSDNNEQTGNAANRAKRASAMELETLHAERDSEAVQVVKQTAREQMIARHSQTVGQIKSAQMFADFAKASSLIWIKEMKETKGYKEFGTWETFCESIGYTRQHVEDKLKNLTVLGERFMQTVCDLGVGYRDLRKLRQLTHDGAVVIDAEAVTIGEERIPLNADHAEDLQAAIEQILEEKADIKKRVTKLEKDHVAVVEEETKGLNAEVGALVREVERLKVFDPDGKNRDWSVEVMEAIKVNLTDFTFAVSKFVIDPRLKGDHQLLAQINAHIMEAEMELRSLRERFETDFEIYGE